MKKKQNTQNEEILSQMEELAKNLGITVRYEKILRESAFFPGGFCRVKDKDLIIINSKASLDDKVEIMVRALIPFDLSQIYVLPAIRELIDNFGESQQVSQSAHQQD
ncbi:MAG: hypothetical protein GX654_20215 [Desulfatiglans sp.]|jgi:hypothetical protein|nr:hypothetical protein [Desulfatiglans sp.]